MIAQSEGRRTQKAPWQPGGAVMYEIGALPPATTSIFKPASALGFRSADRSPSLSFVDSIRFPPIALIHRDSGERLLLTHLRPQADRPLSATSGCPGGPAECLLSTHSGHSACEENATLRTPPARGNLV